ncbi:MAG TPA: hypothetical protein VEC60_14260 [Reyranella sp.]|nr:hypothetical protein [Reyranella sp.]
MSLAQTLRASEPHPFRRSVRFAALKRSARRRPVLTAQDVREFLMAYCACFLAVSTFIA